MDKPICKHCKQVTHPAYLERYDGLCLDCSNAGVDVLMERIAELESELVEVQHLAKLDYEEAEQTARLNTKVEAENRRLREALGTLLASCTSERVIHDPHPVTVKLVSAPSHEAIKQARAALVN